MFERFTKEAHSVVTDAVEEAETRGDSRIGTEHLLIAVSRSENLRDLMPDPEALRAALDRMDEEALVSVGLDPGMLDATPGAPPGRARSRHIPFTGAAKDILTGALKEAVALGHRHIGVEHIALALTDGTGPDRAVIALQGLGLDATAVRASLLQRLRPAS